MSAAEIGQVLFTVIGLCVFEIVSSVDNAVVNADVLGTMSPKGRRWFLLWGILLAVFVVRGALPWLIVWAVSPALGPVAAFTATLTGDPAARRMIEASAPILLNGGGVFLLFLFCHWIFLQKKELGLRPERFIQRQGVWFYAVVSVLLAIIVWYGMHRDLHVGFAAVVGSTAFFITHGFKENAERVEQGLAGGASQLSDLSKILYLEVLDASFSIDGVVGAFAFTSSVPLILLGNGLGAVVLRTLTVRHIETIRRYRLLKSGAMYSIGVLGAVMVLEAMGRHVPAWFPPLSTLLIIGYFAWRSVRLRKVLPADQ